MRSGYNGLVMIHKKAGDLAQYMADLDFRTQTHPFDVSAWKALGEANRVLRRFPLALGAYERVVGIRPSACDARVDLANVQVDVGQLDAAIANLKVCLENDAGYYPATVNLGEAYVEKHDYATARPLLDRALAIRPEGAEALIDIGYIYDAQGDWKTALGYYNRSIRSDPLRPEGYIDLGYDYNQRRFFQLAESAYLKGISVAPDDGRLHYMLAVTYNVQGKIELGTPAVPARDRFGRAGRRSCRGGGARASPGRGIA